MQEHAASAVRNKKDSSIVVGARLVKDGKADAFFSAGNTGAAMAAATLVMGRIPGVQRPAIATVVPTAGPPCVLLDVGANADCKPENLLQFALMGAAYATVVLGVVGPRVALLNIGEEPTKGSQLAQAAHALMAERVPHFIGNVEGRDVLAGVSDVIVTDGFTGNVALKLLEGTSQILLGQVKDAITSTPLNTAASAVLKPALNRLRSRLDPDTYGGAPLLGVAGVCIIGHGSSKATAIASAIRVAAQAGRGGLTQQIAAAVSDN
jgi:glycerol-3-phosphate acyltransferase PlsX